MSALSQGYRGFLYIVSLLPLLMGLSMIVAGAYLLITKKPLDAPHNAVLAESAVVTDFSCGSTHSADYPCQVTVSYQVTSTSPTRTFTTGTRSNYTVGHKVSLYVSATDHTQIIEMDIPLPRHLGGLLVGAGVLLVLIAAGNDWFVYQSGKPASSSNVELTSPAPTSTST